MPGDGNLKGIVTMPSPKFKVCTKCYNVMTFDVFILASNFDPDLKEILTKFLDLIVCKANFPQTFGDMVEQINAKITGTNRTVR